MYLFLYDVFLCLKKEERVKSASCFQTTSRQSTESLLLDIFLMVWMCNNNPFMICNKSSEFTFYEDT